MIFIARISYLATAASFSKITPSIGEATSLAGSAAAVPQEHSARVSSNGIVTADAKHFPNPTARSEIRSRAAVAVLDLDKREALNRTELENTSRELLRAARLPESYLGWTMVVLWSEFWREQISTVPIARRLLLLPDPQSLTQHLDLHHTNGKPAANLLDPVVRLGQAARAAGYQVHLACDSSSAMNAILRGEADAILGAAPLDLLELAIEPLVATGIPCMAVPLPATLSTSADLEEAALRDLIQIPARADKDAATQNISNTRSYVALLREARRMFTPEQLPSLLPGPRPAPANSNISKRLDPLAGTAVIAEQFLAQGGKHSRPFIVMAVYDALTGGAATGSDGAAWVANLSPAIKRVAMSIETFHKASLVHDDIEDDDQFRYGQPTLHRQYGMPTAINVGDYLIGLGYRLVSCEIATLGPEVVADILNRLAQAHLRLCQGQGAELLWRDAGDKALTPDDALEIYALKTSPAFEAALFSGLRLAGSVEQYVEPIQEYARQLGVAFQILNDLGDWRGDDHNKLLAAGDVTGGRPTVLWALALEGLDDAGRAELKKISGGLIDHAAVERIRHLYERSGVFARADQLVRDGRRAAQTIADAINPPELRRLLRYLIETVLDGR
jgi:geranylgeranyl pyrophosphate synthase